jgi:hypothetical protein
MPGARVGCRPGELNILLMLAVVLEGQESGLPSTEDFDRVSRS